MRVNSGLLAVVIVTVGTATLVGQSSPNRHIGRDPRVAIASQLRPDDRHVILQWNGDRPSNFLGPPQGESRLEWLAKQWDIILVVRVERLDPVLIHSDVRFHEREVPADEANWIISRGTMRVDEIIKGADKLGVGDRLSLEVDGGSAMIRGTLVEAVYPWEMPMAPGKRYLLFGRMDNGRFERYDGYAESPTALLMRLRRPVIDPRDPFAPSGDEMEQWTLDQAALLIRQALRK